MFLTDTETDNSLLCTIMVRVDSEHAKSQRNPVPMKWCTTYYNRSHKPRRTDGHYHIHYLPAMWLIKSSLTASCNWDILVIYFTSFCHCLSNYCRSRVMDSSVVLRKLYNYVNVHNLKKAGLSKQFSSPA